MVTQSISLFLKTHVPSSAMSTRRIKVVLWDLSMASIRGPMRLLKRHTGGEVAALDASRVITKFRSSQVNLSVTIGTEGTCVFNCIFTAIRQRLPVVNF